MCVSGKEKNNLRYCWKRTSQPAHVSSSFHHRFPLQPPQTPNVNQLLSCVKERRMRAQAARRPREMTLSASTRRPQWIDNESLCATSMTVSFRLRETPTYVLDQPELES